MQKQNKKSFSEREVFEAYQKKNQKKDWNFPFKFAFEKFAK